MVGATRDDQAQTNELERDDPRRYGRTLSRNEGVRGSSPRVGFAEGPAKQTFLLSEDVDSLTLYRSRSTGDADSYCVGGSSMHVGRLAKDVLPAPVLDRIRPTVQRYAPRLRAPEELKDIELSRLELIRTAPLSDLRDPDFLEHELLPELGLTDEGEEQGPFPTSLHPYMGQGLRAWQFPNQFAPYLARLSGLGIEGYLEIGTRHGGTFVITIEYLSRFNQVRRALGIDLGRPSDSLRAYADARPGVTLLQGNSRGKRFRELVRQSRPFDLVLIDGDHSEEGCRADFELVAERSRVLAFHDISSDPVPGVRHVWTKFKLANREQYEFAEFTDQYDELSAETGAEYIGIGVAIPRAAAHVPE